MFQHVTHQHQFLVSVATAMQPMESKSREEGTEGRVTLEDSRRQKLGMVHPRYEVLTRNGRTRCSTPNIQGTPTAAGFRELFVAAPGQVLLTLDFCFIELCTLAAICESRYGFSVLGEVIRQGIDPHSFTAAIFRGLQKKKKPPHSQKPTNQPF